jgi:hypothetical protein
MAQHSAPVIAKSSGHENQAKNDSTFGSGGRVTTAVSSNAGVNSQRIETNKDIVAMGGLFNPSTDVGSVALARYLITPAI